MGGGNDQSFPNGHALLRDEATRAFGVINIDAHLDVRPLKEGKAHSGSPFRQLIESGEINLFFSFFNSFSWTLIKRAITSDLFLQKNGRFVEFAAQGNQCSAVHADYVLQKGHQIVWLSQLRVSPNDISFPRSNVQSQTHLIPDRT